MNKIKYAVVILIITVTGCINLQNMFVFKPYKRGIRAERERNYIEAIGYYMKDIQKNPHETRSRIAIADVFYTMTFLKIRNNNVTVADLKNTIITNQIAYEIEETDYRKELLKRVYITLIEKYIGLKEFKNAEEYIQRAKKIFVDEKTFDLLQAQVYSEQKKYEDEQRIYTLMLEQKQDLNIEAINNLVVLYVEQENYSKAEETIQSALEKEPNNSKLNFLLGAVYINMNNWELAEKYLNISLKQKNDINTVINLAYVSVWQGEFNKALNYYENALQINPINSDVFLGLGNLFFIQENYSKAIEYYKKGVLITPNKKKILYNLGNSHIKNNDFNDAVTVFERILSIDPYDTLAYENIIYIYGEKLNNKVMSDYFLERYKVVNQEGYNTIQKLITD